MGSAKSFCDVTKGKPSLNRAIMSIRIYPKPCDLTMSRLKSHENGMEDRTGTRRNEFG